MLNVIEPGLLTTVQDLGRLHWYHIGMPPAQTAGGESQPLGSRQEQGCELEAHRESNHNSQPD